MTTLGILVGHLFAFAALATALLCFDLISRHESALAQVGLGSPGSAATETDEPTDS